MERKTTKQQVIDYIKNCPIGELSVDAVAARTGKTAATIRRHFSGYIDARLGKSAKGSDYTIDDLMAEVKALRKEVADLKKTVKINPASWIYPQSFYDLALQNMSTVSFLYEDDTISSVCWGESFTPKVKISDTEFGPEYAYGKVKDGKLVKIIAYKVNSNGD